MKTKKIVNLFALIGFSSILLLGSCAKEDNVTPDDPTMDDKSKFKGNWAVAEKSKDFGNSTYNVTISDSSNSSYLLLAYLYGYHKKTYATVSGNNMTIPKQIIEGGELAGSGILENSRRISLKWTVKTTSTHYDTVTAVLTN
jgi:hypothetical protein